MPPRLASFEERRRLLAQYGVKLNALINNVKVKNIKRWIPPNPAESEVTAQRVRGLLNKLTEINFNTICEVIESKHYDDPKVVDLLFDRAIREPTYQLLYAKVCLRLQNIHKYIELKCKEYKDKADIAPLGSFIGHLYNVRLVENYSDYINSDLSFLCELYTVVGAKVKLDNDVCEANLEYVKPILNKLQSSGLISSDTVVSVLEKILQVRTQAGLETVNNILKSKTPKIVEKLKVIIEKLKPFEGHKIKCEVLIDKILKI